MGYILRRWLADHLPDDLSSGERLVALEVADQANDDTRVAYGRNLLAVVTCRAGYSSEKQVGKVLGKLARDRKIELRVSLRADREVFAYEGKSTTYRIPASNHAGLRCRMDPCPWDHSAPPTGRPLPLSAPPPGGPPDASGPPLGSEWSPAGVRVVPRPGEPSPHISSGSPHPPRARSKIEAAIAASGAADDEIQPIIDKIKAGSPEIRNLAGYITTMAGNGDLAATIADVRAERGRADMAAAIAKARQGPQCLHGTPGGAALHPTGGEPLCALCRAVVRRRASA